MVKRQPPPQLAKARATFADSFPTPEAKTEHYRQLGQRAAAGRDVFSADDVAALRECYDLLRRIAARHPKIAENSPDPTDQAA